MRNYIILNNQNSNTISGLIIQELAPISKPLQRTQVETIDGRDGDIVTPLGYAAYNKKIKIGLYGNFNINDIIAYFATKGTVIFSNEPDKYYYYQIVDQIDYERLVRYRVATVTMHVQPFKYSATEGTITVDASDTVSGEGSDIALDGTAEAPFNVLRHKGNATQKTTSGKNKLAYTLDTLKTANSTSGWVWDGNKCTYKGVTFTVNDDLTISATGTAAGAAFFVINDALALDSGTDYIMTGCPSGGSTSTYTMRLYAGSSYTNETGSGLSFTFSEQTLVRLNIPNGSQVDGIVFKPMIRLASVTDDSYEQYTNGASPNPDYPQDIQVLTGDSTVRITGKNLVDISTVEWGYVNSSGVITGRTSQQNWLSELIKVSPNTTYTFSLKNPSGSDVFTRLSIAYYDSSEQFILRDAQTAGSSTSRSFTTPSNCEWVRVTSAKSPDWTEDTRVSYKPQFELGNQATDYEEFKGQSYVIPFGDTYLAKIGDYADEPVNVDGTWYIRRAIGKAVLDGSENITYYNTRNSIYGARLPVSGSAKHGTGVLCDYLYNVPFTTFTSDSLRAYGQICAHNTTDVDTLYASSPNNTVTDLAGFKTWLGTHNITVYYVLATPTDEAITDQDLIDALDELYEQAHSYKGHTHITATAADGNAPAVLSVEVGEDNESTVTNAGNTTSRPILTIYGQGDIGVYINDVEVLDVALGDEGYITLDSVEMEAYKDTTANLKNRLVTGDYSKLALNAGANKIRFTGKVTKYEISKYSRWL